MGTVLISVSLLGALCLEDKTLVAHFVGIMVCVCMCVCVCVSGLDSVESLESGSSQEWITLSSRAAVLD